MILSAYLDGEVPDRFVSQMETAIQNNPEVRREYEEMKALRDRLSRAPMPDIAESAQRVWMSLRGQGLESRPTHLWRRELRLPLPAVAAAAAVLVTVIGVLIWSFMPSRATPAQKYLANSAGVDVTIRVDGTEMEDVLQWLASQNMLGEINIQLPEQRFELVGETVFVKPVVLGGE
ncbi:MAG: hypothetical protein E4H09_00995 [Spirochaetales bacterium]|nr:MAG: hypothetical protein E4H09_00995 [Spirochaetales bacterium]